MAISAVNQPQVTYQLWTRFNFPTASGPKDALAVPASVANQLNSAYTIMLTMLMAHFWTIVVGFVIFLRLGYGSKVGDKTKPTPISATLWNQRSNLLGIMIETYNSRKELGSSVWLVALLSLFVAAWVGQQALGVLVPPLLILGNAAPVNPDVIYFPVESSQGEPQANIATRYTLEVPSALRALGSVDLQNKKLREKVRVGQATSLGLWNKSEAIKRVDYGYQVSGVDLGLQRYPELLLTVNGSCVTEYGWYNRTSTIRYGSTNISTDTYWRFGDPSDTEDVSLFQGAEPVGSFSFDGPVKGTLERSNHTWLAIVSSVGRRSFTAGTDPWYLTSKDPSGPGGSGAGYTVKSARPALSCWQDDVWSYKGRNSSIEKLTSEALPGLELSTAMQRALSRYLNAPMIYHIGSRLGPSALKSATTAIGLLFDAKASSFQKDLERLVLASYIATCNVLTDSTLYPAEARSLLANAVEGENGQVEHGVADFVVWSRGVSALSIVVLITIPVILVFMWALSIALLHRTKLSLANLLGPNPMFNELVEKAKATLKTAAESTAWDTPSN